MSSKVKPVTGSDKVLRSHLLCVLFLRVRVGDGGDVGSECAGEEDTKVAETSDTDDSDVLGLGSGSVSGERRVEGRTSAHHWGKGGDGCSSVPLV